MKKILVAYFSASETTAGVAKTLAEAASADLYEIRPEVPYTPDDLNWMNKGNRSSIEMQDQSSRPALADMSADISSYETVLVGFPIWWYVTPTIINTFLESYDFSRRIFVLFAISGGSGFGRTADVLKNSVSASTELREGILYNGSYRVEYFENWLKELGIL